MYIYVFMYIYIYIIERLKGEINREENSILRKLPIDYPHS